MTLLSWNPCGIMRLGTRGRGLLGRNKGSRIIAQTSRFFTSTSAHLGLLFVIGVREPRYVGRKRMRWLIAIVVSLARNHVSVASMLLHQRLLLLLGLMMLLGHEQVVKPRVLQCILCRDS